MTDHCNNGTRFAVVRLDHVALDYWPMAFFTSRAKALLFMNGRAADDSALDWHLVELSPLQITDMISAAMVGLTEHVSQWQFNP